MTVREFIRTFLQWFGAASLLCLVAAVTFVAIHVAKMNGEPNTKPARPGDLQFIFNWSGLDPKQQFAVINSYVSPPHFLGDHLDYHCMQIEHFGPAEIYRDDWVFGPEPDPIAQEARDLLAGAGELAACFSGEENAASPDIGAFIVTISVHLRRPDGAQILFFHRPTYRLLYVSLAT